MQIAIWSEPEEVDVALSRLGLEIAPLIQAVQRGYVAFISRTKNDAPNAGGFYQWNETLRTLREGLASRGWAASNDRGYPTAVHPAKRMAIAVSSGDQGTGNPKAIPTTKRDKGPCTAAMVCANATQLDLFPTSVFMVKEKESERLTWLLLFYSDGRELRAELSLPLNIDDGGYIKAWKERIILPTQPLEPTITVPEPDFGPDLDIDIQRRA